VTLVLKLVLVPGLIALATVAGRRFGPRIGGWLNALPLVAGPVLFFLALEQGTVFVARAAETTLTGLAAVAAFAVIYSWTAVTRRWWVCVLAGWAAFGLLTIALQTVHWTTVSGLALAMGAFGVARSLLPRLPEAPPPARAPAWVCRCAWPPRWCWCCSSPGSPRGSARVSRGRSRRFPSRPRSFSPSRTPSGARRPRWAFLRAFLPAMWSFALFCFVLARGVVGFGRDLAFVLALALSLAVQGIVLLGLETVASRETARRGPRAARRSA
jgi:hypothetical protein